MRKRLKPEECVQSGLSQRDLKVKRLVVWGIESIIGFLKKYWGVEDCAPFGGERKEGSVFAKN